MEKSYSYKNFSGQSIYNYLSFLQTKPYENVKKDWDPSKDYYEPVVDGRKKKRKSTIKSKKRKKSRKNKK